MFTGIINYFGIVTDIANSQGDKIFTIQSNLNENNFIIGASICHNGVCLTVLEKGKSKNGLFYWKVQASTHTLNLTNLGHWNIGTKINIEPSLKMGDEIGGHLVSGHVDGIGEVIGVDKIFESTKISIKAPSELIPFIAQKGSIAIEGVSLTINEVVDSIFSVNIIEHTAKNTTIGSFFSSMKVNLEIDPIARYVGQWLKSQSNCKVL